MNVVDYGILAIIGLCVVAGMYRGLISSLMSTIGLFASWFGAFQLYPQLSAAIQGNRWLMGILEYYVDAASQINTPGLQRQLVSVLSGEQFASIVSDIKLPGQFAQLLKANIESLSFQSLGLSQVGEYVNHTILVLAINIASFLLMLVLSYVVVNLVINLLSSVFQFPVLRHLDGLAGGVLGAVRGYFFVFLLFSLVPLLLTAMPVQIVSDIINGSRLGSHFMQSNFINSLIQSMM